MSPTTFVLFVVDWCLVYITPFSWSVLPLVKVAAVKRVEDSRVHRLFDKTDFITLGCVPSVGLLGREWSSCFSSLRDVHTWTFVPKPCELLLLISVGSVLLMVAILVGVL